MPRRRRRLGNSAVLAGAAEAALNAEVYPVLRETADDVGYLMAAAGVVITEVDWTSAPRHTLTLGANVTGLQFVDPDSPGDYTLLVSQTGAFTLGGWPSSVRWFGGAPPVITPTPGAVDLIRFYFDGSAYYGEVRQGA